MTRQTTTQAELTFEQNAKERRFKRYPDYRDSGNEWLGLMPTSWRLKRLKYVALVIMGQSPASDECNTDGQGTPFLQGNAEFGSPSPTPRQFCLTAPKHAPAGAFLLSVRAPVGALNIADQGYGIGRGLCAVVPTESRLQPSFAWHLLSVIRDELSSLATGSTYEAVSVLEVANMTAILPPLPEQRAIAAFLDHETARIDELIAKKERLIELLQEKRTALISHAVTKGLNPDAPMRDSGVEWLGQVPEHWEVLRSKVIFSLFNGYAFDGKSFSRADQDAPVLVTPGNFRPDGGIYFEEGNTTHYIGEPPREFELEIGDYLIVMTDLSYKKLILGSCVRVDREGLLLNQRVARVDLRPNRRKAIELSFLEKALNSRPVREQVIQTARGSTVFHSSPTKIGDVILALPPLEEQVRIASFLGRRIGEIDAVAQRVGDCIDYLREYRSALISSAVTGKIDVRSYVPEEAGCL